MSGSLRVLPAWPQQDIFRLNCSHRRGGDFERVYPLIRPLAWEKEGLPADAGASPACETLVGSALACAGRSRLPDPIVHASLEIRARPCRATLRQHIEIDRPSPPAATGFCSFSSGFASCLHTPTNNFPGRKEGRKEGRKDGRKDGRTEGRKDGRKEGRKEGRTEGRKDGRTEGRKDGRKEGRKEGWKEGRKEGRKLTALKLARSSKPHLNRDHTSREAYTELSGSMRGCLADAWRCWETCRPNQRSLKAVGQCPLLSKTSQGLWTVPIAPLSGTQIPRGRAGR